MISQSFSARQLGTYDACIVGSGPAGLALALEMGRRGRRVLVLESGGDGPDAGQQGLSDARIVDPARHDEMAIAVSRQLGGTSNLWAGRCQPFDPIDFIERPWVGARWPVGLEEIAKFYPPAVDYLAAGEAVFGGEGGDSGVDSARLERFSNIPGIHKHFAQELEQSALIDLRLRSTLVEMLVEGGSIRGIVVADTDGTRHEVPVTRLVLACGGLESTRLLLALQRTEPGLFGPMLGRNYMGHLIGEVADITFHAAGADAAFDFFKDGHGSYARRRLIPSDEAQIEHQLLNISFWPVVPPVADARHRSGILSMVCLAFAIPWLGRLLVAEAIRKRHIPAQIDWWAHLRNVITDLPRTLAYIPSFFWRRYFARERLPGFFIRNAGRHYGLSYHSEQSPQFESRVRLSDEVDRLGLPKLEIDQRFARADAEAVLRSHLVLKAWAERTGFASIEFRQPEAETVDAILALASHGTHQIGTARMGTSVDDGVVDANLCCFGLDNLYVASSAVFPTSGQCNPTLSIVAFALRLAEHLCAERPRASTSSA